MVIVLLCAMTVCIMFYKFVYFCCLRMYKFVIVIICIHVDLYGCFIRNKLSINIIVIYLRII